ncbi:hypothetical protein EIN_491010 [Entamoeba invadens IP1]|uniref:Radical SAM core domain-containing protein n=1 Tax=Entamoeba invadens IP1 TaxID=370355 RepID=A0A0A1U3Z2_ENTIV|nr:hypothetical protein EIN_491010 [Entamoeba invadens IP1]ELP88952.1 hypothetical protein EIN_491010 [Entamoeba invadens IP1]|eukprot:XP_004255723.1 hypothetical protein EIN_491010 [Entamoeba invadens IP1]
MSRQENTNECIYRKLDNGKVQCLACNRYCVIPPGQTGVCAVRENVDGVLRLIVYGKVIGPGPSPVEKKPMFHFLPGTQTYSLATIGCNFTCKFCQNWDISQCAAQVRDAGGNYVGKIEKYGYAMTAEDVVKEAIKEKCPAIAYTYNEPTVFLEYALDVARIAKAKGLKNIFVTNGYESKEAIEAMKGLIDGMNIDLKGFTDKFYSDLAGTHLEPVKKTIRLARESGIWVEVTTLIIPGQNDSEKELKELAEFLVNVDPNMPWHISAFHPDYLMDNIPPTPVSTLRMAYDIGKTAGLHHIYVGNVSDPSREATYCKKCGEMLVKRSRFRSVILDSFVDGVCTKCGTPCDGVWK